MKNALLQEKNINIVVVPYKLCLIEGGRTPLLLVVMWHVVEPGGGHHEEEKIPEQTDMQTPGVDGCKGQHYSYSPCHTQYCYEVHRVPAAKVPEASPDLDEDVVPKQPLPASQAVTYPNKESQYCSEQVCDRYTTQYA